ncbi:MAG: GTP 3',8-cyclase MoaA [Phycisphaerales bacterium]
MSYALPLLDESRLTRSDIDPNVDSPSHSRPLQRDRLIDSHGRTIHELRLSITDRCNFRCVYCMEPDVRFALASTLLSPEELERVARVCVSLGVTKIRLTGGEPTVHPRLTEIISRIASLGVRDIAITTNGSLLTPRSLAAWKSAGLTRITISLDSLRPDRFATLTRSTSTPDDILRGVDHAIDAGLSPVKVNAVVMRRFNEDEVADIAALARRYPIDVRFIEAMPLDSARAWDESRLVSADEILERVSRVWPLVPLDRECDSATSERYAFADAPSSNTGTVGVIAPVTRAFCGACSRLRITADGMVRPCLFSTTEYDLKSALRAGASDDDLATILLDATWRKQPGHGIRSSSFTQPTRPMSAIGG